MKRSITVLLMLLVGTLCFAQNTAKQTPSKTITGTVTDARTGETLIGATIYDTLSHKGTVTNQHGRFSLTLPGQRAVLRISFVGYQLQFHPVSLNQNTRLNVQLEGSTTLAEVRIIGQRTPHVESSQASVIEIPVEQIQAIPMLFGETDVVKAVQLLPGVQNGSEGTAGMYVRGGGPDENLFLLDGVPMYNVNHLGGFFSAFNSDAVKNIQLYKGSFPARFGSRLSSVLDITTNNGNDTELHGGVSVTVHLFYRRYRKRHRQNQLRLLFLRRQRQGNPSLQRPQPTLRLLLHGRRRHLSPLQASRQLHV